MIKERCGTSWWERLGECKKYAWRAFEQGGTRWGWCEGLILKLGQAQRKMDIWISASVTFSSISGGRLSTKQPNFWSTLSDCWLNSLQPKGNYFFSSWFLFLPQSHFRRQVQGEGGPPLFSYMEINPPPHTPCTPKPLPVCEESHCGPNTVLILLLRGVGVHRDKSIFSSALLN